MEHVVRMPKLGLTMEEGEVLEWHVAAGQDVAEGEELLTIGTDKAETAVESPCDGRVTELHAEPGDVQPVGEPLCTVLERDDG